jgi:dienelactone hydrolase
VLADRAIAVSTATAVVALCLAMVAAPAARSQSYLCDAVATGQAELIEFASAMGDGALVHVRAVLRKPEGDGTFPVLLLLHGQGGVIPPRCFKGAVDLFTSLGYVTLLIDSESQTDKAGTRFSEHTSTDQALHALAGARYLASLSYVDADRIGVVGWSTGGLSAIKVISDADLREADDPSIRAAVGIYPICPANTPRLDAPLLILIGGDDTVTPASSCHAFMEAVLTDNVEMVVYPGAVHGFDAPASATFNPSAAADAYERINRHFGAHLGGQD